MTDIYIQKLMILGLIIAQVYAHTYGARMLPRGIGKFERHALAALMCLALYVVGVVVLCLFLFLIFA